MKKFIFVLVLAMILIGILFFTFLPTKQSMYKQNNLTSYSGAIEFCYKIS